MELSLLNDILKDFNILRRDKSKLVSTNVIKGGPNDEDMEDEEGISYEVYQILKDTFIQLEIRTDSYGDNERVFGIKFVKPINKSVTLFDTI